MSVDRARILFAQYFGGLANRHHIRVDRNGALESEQSGAGVTGAQADLPEAGQRTEMARFELERTGDVVETIGVALLDES